MRRTSYLLSLFLLLTPLPAFGQTVLDVPFSSQSPDGIWIEPWQNACEETVTIMVDHFYRNQQLDTEAAKQAILALYEVKTKTYGWSLDENAEKIVNWINAFFPWEARIVKEPDIHDIEDEIDAGRPVIVPVYAPYLQNPRFSGFFAYHTIVIHGYDHVREVFITQEPGTRYGENYEYSYETIMNAMHDFVPGGTRTSQQLAIFTSPDVTERSARIDADNDGLDKEDELLYGTSLMLADTDDDGYNDGQEVAAGFSPLRNETGNFEGALVKSADDPKVYIVHGNEKRHISSEAVFLRNGWRWEDIQIVSRSYLIYLDLGEPVI